MIIIIQGWIPEPKLQLTVDKCSKPFLSPPDKFSWANTSKIEGRAILVDVTCAPYSAITLMSRRWVSEAKWSETCGDNQWNPGSGSILIKTTIITSENDSAQLFLMRWWSHFQHEKYSLSMHHCMIQLISLLLIFHIHSQTDKSQISISWLMTTKRCKSPVFHDDKKNEYVMSYHKS